MRVLLLTASYGDGHHQVAAALSGAFGELGVETREFDCIRSNRGPGASGEWLYAATTRFTPGLYGLSYRITRNLAERHPLWRVLSIPLRSAVTRAIGACQPDVVLQLFPERVLLDVPRSLQTYWTGMVITDYSVHRRWFHRGVQAYFLPDRRMLTETEAFMEAGACGVDTGIPLRPQFWTDSPADGDAQSLRPEADAAYVLIATGGRGLFPDLERTIGLLVERLPGHRVYVMCGKNEQMIRSVERLGEKWQAVGALPFVQDVARWLRRASFALVKSGGLTVSECFATGCPMLMYRPQPGQEADNAAFVARIGAGVVVRRWAEMSAALSMLADAGKREAMSKAAFAASHPDAARSVAAWIVKHVADRVSGP